MQIISKERLLFDQQQEERKWLGKEKSSLISSGFSQRGVLLEKKNFLAGKMINMLETDLCLGLPGGGGGSGAEPETPKTNGKRGFSETVDLKLNIQAKSGVTVDLTTPQNMIMVNDSTASTDDEENLSSKDPAKPPAKSQVVGWPPVRSYRKNAMSQKNPDGGEKGGSSAGSAMFVKVCMDGAPYLRKVDLKMYKSYQELSNALAKMFSSFTMAGKYGAQGMIDFMNESKLMDLLNSSEYVPSYEDKDGDWMLVGDVPWEMFVDSCKRLRIMKGSEAIGLAPRAMEKCKSRS